MRRTDENSFDPEVAEMLEAIDATLAGEPVDPRHADVAELALLLVADRPRPDALFARELDAQVARRFASVTGGAGAHPMRRAWWRGWHAPAGAVAAVVCAVVAVIAVVPSGGGPSGVSGSAGSSAAFGTSSSASASVGVAHTTAGPAARTPKRTSSAAGSTSSLSSAALPFSANGALAPGPVPNGRKLIQSAQLALSAPASHIDDVSQEVFNVVHQVNGYVENSSVTQGSGGSAQFQLSIPTSALQTAMNALSSLHYASVVSRTDATQDVNGQYLGDVRALADARALRTSLLKALAAATTQTQIDSLKAQINDAEASIRSDESTLNHLNHQIDYSQVTVSVNGAAPVPVTHHSGGFTISRALHDARRVLTVLAGVGLIALAVLVPLGLVGGAVALVVVGLRRRWREQALDVAV